MLRDVWPNAPKKKREWKWVQLKWKQARSTSIWGGSCCTIIRLRFNILFQALTWVGLGMGLEFWCLIIYEMPLVQVVLKSTWPFFICQWVQIFTSANRFYGAVQIPSRSGLDWPRSEPAALYCPPYLQHNELFCLLQHVRMRGYFVGCQPVSHIMTRDLKLPTPNPLLTCAISHIPPVCSLSSFARVSLLATR